MNQPKLNTAITNKPSNGAMGFLSMLFLVTILLFVCVVILLGMVMWALPRGFVLSDEGFYLLNYQKGQETTFISGFGGVIRWLFRFTDVRVNMLRWLRLAVTVFGCTALAAC